MKTLLELDKGQRGCAGEYLVCGELNKRGIIASLTIKNTRGMDILASNSDASKSAGIQVKTTIHARAKYPSWILGEKADTYVSDNLFYVFVLLKADKERPDFYIVPSKIVADYIKTETEKWMKSPSKTGKPHVDSGIRLFEIYEDEIAKKYYNNWELLGLDENEHN